jgi:tRNA(fMet)-specific endonuclease VapC
VSFLIDTDVIINFLHGRQDAINLIRHLRPQGLSVSVASCGEVWEGIPRARNPEQHETDFQVFLSGVETLVVTLDDMREFARLRGELRAIGQLIPDMDLLIAATAVRNGLTLVTRNRRHFDRVPGLRLYEGS